MVESAIAVGDAAEAAVNAPALVQLYAPDGARSIYVDEAEAAHWLGQGYTRTRLDVATAARELRVLFDAARDAVQVFVAGVVADGQIDASDGAAQATACMAMQELEQAWGRLQTGIALRYPKAEPTPVRMRDPRGREAAFDPSQVAAYAADGWEVI